MMNKKKTLKKIGYSVLIMAGLAVIFGIVSFLIPSKVVEKEITRLDILYPMAKKATLQRLKAPGSAVFYDSLSRMVQLTSNDTLSNQFRLDVVVDAQNGFGAMLRKTYFVVYSFDGLDSLKEESYVISDFF